MNAVELRILSPAQKLSVARDAQRQILAAGGPPPALRDSFARASAQLDRCEAQLANYNDDDDARGLGFWPVLALLGVSLLTMVGILQTVKVSNQAANAVTKPIEDAAPWFIYGATGLGLWWLWKKIA